MSLDGNHHIGLIQHEHINLLQVKKVELKITPVQNLYSTLWNTLYIME